MHNFALLQGFGGGSARGAGPSGDPHCLAQRLPGWARVAAQGKQLVFVTNNSTKSRAGYLKKFTSLGLNVAAVRRCAVLPCAVGAQKGIGLGGAGFSV